ncbi:2451_t:CDS:2, partial [Gigaspora rosea]
VQTVETSPFSSSFPLPYRVLIIATIGLCAWGSNMQILSWVSIGVQALLTGGKKKFTSQTIYKLALFMSIWVIFSGFDSDVYFCDKILADIMTSHAKVFGDLYVTMCILFIYNEDPMQCIAVYLHSKDPKNTGREHLFNALKYCSAFPVISYWITPSTIFNLCHNSYFLLRFTWSLKHSSRLHLINHLEPSVFLMECLEVTRRWIWIFFKFESESAEINKDPYIPLHNTSS